MDGYLHAGAPDSPSVIYRKRVAEGDAARRQAEATRASGLRNAAAEASAINATRLDRNIAAAMAQSPTPAVPQAARPLASQSVPASPQLQGGMAPQGGAGLPGPGPAPSPTGLRERFAQAYLQSPGSRVKGAEMMVANEKLVRDKEEADLTRILQMATKDPAAAIAWAQGNGVDIPPGFRQILGDRAATAKLAELMGTAKAYYGTGADVRNERATWVKQQLGTWVAQRRAPAPPAAAGVAPVGSAPGPGGVQPRGLTLPEPPKNTVDAPKLTNLAPGDVLFDPSGKEVARSPYKPGAGKAGAGAPKVSKVLLTTDGGATAVMSDGSLMQLSVKVLNEAKSNPVAAISRMTSDIMKDYNFKGTAADAQRQAIDLYQKLREIMGRTTSPATPPSPESQDKEGDAATNPQTGETLVYHNGQWVRRQ